MDREALRRELTEQFHQSLDQAMDAVERAPDGSWIPASEWQVREAFQRLTAQAYGRILQAKLDDAAHNKQGGAFSPSGGQSAEGVGPARRGRADRRR